MVRILVILLSLASLLTLFQNCSSGGTLALEKSSLGKSGFDKLLGSCSSLPAGALCNERWSGSLADRPAFQSSCSPGGVYQAFECPVTPDKLGVCETLQGAQLNRLYYYSGYSQGALSAAQEGPSAQAQCGGTWSN